MWAYLKERWLRRQARNRWRLVAKREAEFVLTDRKNKKVLCVYYLYENGIGERRCETWIQPPFDALMKATDHPYYAREIVTWVQGQTPRETPKLKIV